MGAHEDRRALDLERPVIARTINRRQRVRRRATRDAKLAAGYLAMVTNAMIPRWR